MKAPRILVLGPIELQPPSRLDLLQSKIELAVLAYLAVRKRIRTRELEALFWPNAKNRANRLAQAILFINKAMSLEKTPAGRVSGDPSSDETANGRVVLRAKDHVLFGANETTWVDLEEFGRLAGVGDEPSLRECTKLCRGWILEDIEEWRGLPRDRSSSAGITGDARECAEVASDFELWLLRTQEHWRQKCSAVHEKLIGLYADSERYHDALDVAWSLYLLDPLDERATLHIMTYLSLTGRPRYALAHGESYRKSTEEQGLEPTTDFYQLQARVRKQISTGSWESHFFQDDEDRVTVKITLELPARLYQIIHSVLPSLLARWLDTSVDRILVEKVENAQEI